MTVKIKHPYVEKRAGVCGGRAVVKGTRIPAWLLFKRYRAGETIEELQASYSRLSLSQILDAVGYALDNLEEINSDIQINAEATWKAQLKDSISLPS